ncbi:MAG: S9 family peptidase [Acidobacteriota bacterium]
MAGTRNLRTHSCVWLLWILGAGAFAAPGASPGYRLPPDPIPAMLERPPLPTLVTSPDHRVGALLYREGLPSLEELARPMLRLAGKRFYPEVRVPAGRIQGRLHRIEFLDIDSGRTWPAQLPETADVRWFEWSPDGKRLAVGNLEADGVHLWMVTVESGEAAALPNILLNLVSGGCSWLPDSRRLLCRLVPEGLGAPPERPRVPEGPLIQETSGKRAQVRTYQDLLRDRYDAAAYEYYARTQLAILGPQGERRNVGKPGLYGDVEVSPDGRFFLVERIHPPYSYLVPEAYFPVAIELWDRDGGLVRSVADLPLAEEVPIGGVRTGPRQVHWVPGKGAVLAWAEALDGGDPKRRVSHRDRLMILADLRGGEPREVYRAEWRIRDLSWTTAGHLLLTEWDRDRQWLRTWLLRTPLGERLETELIWDRGQFDAYKDPGRPVTWTTPAGKPVVLQVGEWLYLIGRGSSPQGDRPFLARFSLDSLEQEVLFRSREARYEFPVDLLDPEGGRVLVRSEAPDDPPDYAVVNLDGGRLRQLTNFPDPAPELRKVKKELITYHREDGVLLSGTLYLPEGYRRGTPVPLVMWAYPREYNDPDIAGQVRGSPYLYNRVTGASHLFFLTQGYAVLDGPAMPVVGENGNDTFVEQLVMNAKAAVDKVVAMGVTRRGKIGIGGHSYGAFMTANLLAHSDFFAAGIARSGAYNRTLTPFGFQNERRTFWEAPEVYFAMSPFMHADKINEPLLLIHGQADNNSGTFPLQSERMFHALKGLGGTARLVLLPYESHGYAARESVLHVLAEMIEWFDRYVKGRQ